MAIQIEEVSADYTGLIATSDYQEYLRFDGTDQDTILPGLIESAIRMAEGWCNASFGNKSYLYENDNVEQGCKYYLPFPKVRSVDTVKRVDPDGNITTLTEGKDFFVGGLNRKWIEFSLGYTTSITKSRYQVEYTTGNENPSTVNVGVKEGILSILSENFENRVDGLVGSNIQKMPRNSMVKLAPYKNPVF